MTVAPPGGLPAKKRPEPSARSLNQWLRDAEKQTASPQQWLGWQLASTIVIAALQRAMGPDAVPLFLVKGGVYVEMQLGGKAPIRATKDIDTLFRGTVADFATTLRQVMAQPWGPFTLETSDIEQIAGAKRLVKPCRFDVRLNLKGAIWRRVRVEASFPEAHIADHAYPVPVPPVGFYGVDAPDQVSGIVMDYQVAQKLHACTDPDTTEWTNDRVRDVIDINLLHDHFYPGDPPASLKRAVTDLFEARASEAAQLGEPTRHWPPVVTANNQWRILYPDLAASVGLELPLDAAIAQLNTWITAIDAVVDDNER
jgi:hypothetical protein